MPIIIGLIVAVLVLFAVGPMILKALGHLIGNVIGLVIILAVIALGVAIPPLGAVMLSGVIIYAFLGKKS
ncbi:hypothetical protein ACX7S9_002503 [Morganella morganii]|uniref:hypothetical protein n=1 Tax=Morganella morganii TaxID=582 RepID=UPI000668F7A1|nr:hypothetical protein [Morganella morganii]SSN08161.1 Uncharacterised protein [Klebsiella pneumoniae]EJD6111620.1 hypothetical protein [Morganella morganii]EJG2206113.1 hypothetical protein [Morganella morganii]EKU4015222.1 hypothetical protein [Morganella morganii]ELA7701689.1 hypothetical protein [Morganella morganii]